MRAGTAKEIKFESIDSLFGIPDESKQHVTTMIPLESLYPYAQHPFRVLDDAKMDELVESIRTNGVLEPALVRPRTLGGYEIISGHRRKRACEKAGLEEIPVIIRELTDDESAILMVDSNNQREELDTMPMFIRNYTDDEATIIMVDSNIQREDILPSEKAKAYRMKYEAMKHQGKKFSESSAEQLGKENNKSGRQIKRYIRLTYLQEDLLDLVDQKKIAFRAAENLSFLTETEQNILLEAILEHKVYPNIDTAEKLKQMSGAVSIERVEEVLLDRKQKSRATSIPVKNIRKYFSEESSAEEMEQKIIELLEKWRQEEGHEGFF